MELVTGQCGQAAAHRSWGKKKGGKGNKGGERKKKKRVNTPSGDYILGYKHHG